jgi:hypothetical protein
MKFDLKTASPWHEFTAMLLNASSMSIDGYEGEVEVENVDGHLSIKVAAKPAKKSVLKSIKGGKD